jgi:cytochrome c oxidase subunit 3
MRARRECRTVLNVGDLPDVVFGSRDLSWWGTLGFVLIEGFTLALCAGAYVYLLQRNGTWPPLGDHYPSLGMPTAELIVMLASIPVLAWMGRAANAFDLRKVRIGLTLATLFGFTFVATRMWVLTQSLNIRWNSDAYGSALWLVVGMHATLLIVEAVEIAGMTLIFWVKRPEPKHFSDAADLAFYWYFMVLGWVPLYVLCFWVPRWT